MPGLSASAPPFVASSRIIPHPRRGQQDAARAMPSSIPSVPGNLTTYPILPPPFGMQHFDLWMGGLPFPTFCPPPPRIHLPPFVQSHVPLPHSLLATMPGDVGRQLDKLYTLLLDLPVHIVRGLGPIPSQLSYLLYTSTQSSQQIHEVRMYLCDIVSQIGALKRSLEKIEEKVDAWGASGFSRYAYAGDEWGQQPHYEIEGHDASIGIQRHRDEGGPSWEEGSAVSQLTTATRHALHPPPIASLIGAGGDAQQRTPTTAVGVPAHDESVQYSVMPTPTMAPVPSYAPWQCER